MGTALLAAPVWRQLLLQGEPVSHCAGELAGRSYRDLLAAPFVYRGVFLGYIALLDKEVRGSAAVAFSSEDQRFLDSVAALGGVALDSARQLEDLTVRSERLAEENKALKGRLVEEFSGQRIVAHAPAMRRALEKVERVAPRRVSVLLRGESGTGKELVAKLAHFLSGRSGPLIALNCAALPESLLESELFGIEGGVATGVEARRGKFELAQGGTLFLDEIGDLELSLQVKLLRVLQEREVVPVGGEKAIAIDVRLVAATHRGLEDMVSAGEFREDLYYRLKGVDIELPPLRERRQDIPYLVKLFAEEFCRLEGIRVPQFEPEGLNLLMDYDYPGNVRELQNFIHGALSLADEVVDKALLRSLMSVAEPEGARALDMASVEKQHIEHVIRLVEGNKSAAAKILGLDRRTLQRKGF
jgi:transcriptional regulator with GAF, ATPase, and Fis domain